MASIPYALGQIKEDFAKLVGASAIHAICAALGHGWRDRKLDPVTTVHLFLLQILHGNTACGHVRHMVAIAFTASAYCQARARLPVDVFRVLAHRVTGTLDRCAQEVERWCGHRVFHLDGSSFSMPDTPALQEHFGQPGAQRAGCGFPTAHVLGLCDAATGFLIDAIVSPLRTHDMAQVTRLHPHLTAGDVVVMDRGFCSFAHLALLAQAGVHAIARMHQRQIVRFKKNRPCTRQVKTAHRKGHPTSAYVRYLGRYDQVVEWFKPTRGPAWMTREQFDALPASILVRELRYRIGRPGFRTRSVTLATTLLDAKKYAKKALAEQYRRRWRIEINFRHLKQTLGMDTLRCQSVDGVMKEVWMFLLVYNLVRMLMLTASRRQGVAADRISFIDAWRWLLRPGGQPACDQLIVNPHRPNRLEPRVVKRRPKSYKRMTKPRQEIRNLLENKAVAA